MQSKSTIDSQISCSYEACSPVTGGKLNREKHLEFIQNIELAFGSCSLRLHVEM